MVTRAVLRYARISPRKVRPVVPLVKGKRPEEAIAILFSVKKKASQLLIDLLRSALANAKRMQGVDMSALYVSRIVADGGPQMKRFRAASMGRAGMIRKRTSHITVELDRITEPPDRHKEEPVQAHAVKAPHKAAKAAPERAARERHAAPAKHKVKGPAKPEPARKGR
jgi:large subunit ribosomal protein L22